MLTIDDIKSSYPESLHTFSRSLIREYLQYQILTILFQHTNSRKLSFLGGTCLRVIYGLPRFSEDIDFDNKDLSFQEFSELAEYLATELQARGYVVENRLINQTAFYCYIKFPELLYKQGLSPLKEEKILIQIDTFDQGVQYKPEIFILNKFEFFQQILHTPKSIILSQKLWTITRRERLKGRDFYDIMFLLQNTRPDISFLKEKFGTESLSEIKDKIIDHLKYANFDSLLKDLRPFLQKPEEAEKIKFFKGFLEQELK
jgi:predicted nucleotidyltransferase component of viral defense system